MTKLELKVIQKVYWFSYKEEFTRPVSNLVNSFDMVISLTGLVS